MRSVYLRSSAEGSAPESFNLNRLINDRETTSAFSIQRKRLSVFQSVRRREGPFNLSISPRDLCWRIGLALSLPGRRPPRRALFYEHATGNVVKLGLKFMRHHASAKEKLKEFS